MHAYAVDSVCVCVCVPCVAQSSVEAGACVESSWALGGKGHARIQPGRLAIPAALPAHGSGTTLALWIPSRTATAQPHDHHLGAQSAEQHCPPGPGNATRTTNQLAFTCVCMPGFPLS